ncbi:MAG: hypothetical protein Q8M96_23000 [Rubrivivax sp.]|nr:hypothetical protein [Rubrivivax sp.]
MLVLALPVQGAAAATMAFCGPDHHGGGAAVAQPGSTPAVHTHHGDALAGDEPPAIRTADVASIDDVSAIVTVGQAAMQTCSACASCCSLGAILTLALVVPVTDLSPTLSTTVVPTVGAFAADGLERPPRNVLA